MTDFIYLVYLHSIGISQRKLSIIFENNSNYKEFFEKLSHNSLKIFYQDKDIETILKKRENLNEEKINKLLKDRNVQVITINDNKYPKSLKQIANPPYFFYLRGEIDDSPKIVIIGSRSMTSYGKKIIEKFIPTLIKYFVIVSGGAFGCDSEAHKQTIINAGKTIAVVGTGIDLDYPIQNQKLFDDIVANNGGIISIFPLGEIANNYNFPIRNEIVSALSNGVIVIESAEKSGTLITANLALEQGKDVFAIPGDLYKTNSTGCNNLIKNGYAKMVTTPEDILEEYNIKPGITNNCSLNFSNDIEKIIYNNLLLECLDNDEIVIKTGISLNQVMTNLSMMEISGIIRKNIAGKYEIQ
ncbi:DNA-protecting protein DprA [Candidatus Gracilibacteria bacterium]|nr:DNA-protecting protein DprA [Candidatus Gracilibacteria bacterium]